MLVKALRSTMRRARPATTTGSDGFAVDSMHRASRARLRALRDPLALLNHRLPSCQIAQTGIRWGAILEENSPGRMDPHVPVLIVHGQRDDIVPIAQTAQLQARYCAFGAPVSRRLYAGQD